MTVWVRTDFNGLFGDVLCLSHEETCEGPEGEVVPVEVGMRVVAFEEDGTTAEGQPDALVAAGTVERAPPDLACKWFALGAADRPGQGAASVPALGRHSGRLTAKR